nr:2OG-Fe(II) oxygenase [Chiayiivirga flava]
MPAVFSVEECERIVAIARAHPGSQGTVDARADAADPIRRSTVRFLNPEPASEWIFARLDQAVTRLNAAYAFELQAFAEGVQIASYTDGGHYGWHADLGPGAFSRRKLSLSVQLSPDADYDGGDLEFLVSRDSAARSQGALIAFPSFLVHRVTPVTRGERWSMVSWIAGPPFR